MSQYRVCGPRPVLGTEPGELLDRPLSDSEEADLLASGRVELVPSIYRVVGPREVHNAKLGQSFEAALTVGEERSLIEGGHVELVAEDASGLESLKRDELEQLASDAGVDEPEKLPNKAAVIDAITATDNNEQEGEA